MVIPISLCILFSVSLLDYTKGTKRKKHWIFHFDDINQSNRTSAYKSVYIYIFKSLVNALTFIAFVVIFTFAFSFSFIYDRFALYKLVVIISTTFILGCLPLVYFVEYCKASGATPDWISVVLVLWNFSVLGTIVIYTRGPLLLQQSYFVVCSSLAVLDLVTIFSDLTFWFILTLLIFWDLILCKYGPFDLMMKKFQRGEELSMFYSTGHVDRKKEKEAVVVQTEGDLSPHSGITNEPGVRENPEAETTEIVSETALETNVETPDKKLTKASSQESPHRKWKPWSHNNDAEKERESQLGLGDLVCYSLLVTKVASYGDHSTLLMCYVSVIFGLIFTDILLRVHKKALLVLYIPLPFTIIVFVVTNFVTNPFITILNETQIFI
jgi:hypothetical protein